MIPRGELTELKTHIENVSLLLAGMEADNDIVELEETIKDWLNIAVDDYIMMLGLNGAISCRLLIWGEYIKIPAAKQYADMYERLFFYCAGIMSNRVESRIRKNIASKLLELQEADMI